MKTQVAVLVRGLPLPSFLLLLPSLSSPVCGLCPVLLSISQAHQGFILSQPQQKAELWTPTGKDSFNEANTEGMETWWLLDFAMWPTCSSHIISLVLAWSWGQGQGSSCLHQWLRPSGALDLSSSLCSRWACKAGEGNQREVVHRAAT